MVVLALAMVLTLVLGFLAGREYDRSIKRINYNRKLRREKIEKMRKAEAMQRRLDEERRKNEFMYGVQNGYF